MNWWNLYFIQESGTENIKIGIARDVKKRKYQMQTDNPNKLKVLGIAKFGSEQAVKKAESRLHALFASQLVRGEWFAASDCLLLVAASAA